MLLFIMDNTNNINKDTPVEIPKDCVGGCEITEKKNIETTQEINGAPSHKCPHPPLPRNRIREISNYITSFIPVNVIRMSKPYMILHTLFIAVIGFVALFSCNMWHLAVLLIVVSLDALSIVVLHECPLTTLERKYYGESMCDIRSEEIKKAGIVYTCDHEYEKQIELLINVWMIVAGKCCCVLFMNTVNMKLINYGNLYM